MVGAANDIVDDVDAAVLSGCFEAQYLSSYVDDCVTSADKYLSYVGK